MSKWLYRKTNLNAVIYSTAFNFFVFTGNAQPVASFSAAPTAGCVPLTVNFQDNSAGADAYYWDFGNGNTSTLQNPSSAYLSPGFYTVSLVAINSLTGQRDTFIATNYIHAVQSPNTAFSASPLSDCINNNLISFTNATTGGVSYTWDFGDGTTSTLQNPTHTYANAGSYTIKLVATNGFNCSTILTKSNYITIHNKPKASISAGFTSSCDSTDVFSFSGSGSGITSWNWNFGDGSTSTLQNPTHVYNSTGSFTVTLIATNSNGCKDTVIANNYINIGNSLVPGFSVTNNVGCGSLTTTFTALVQNAVTWLWNFGDGTTSTQQSPTHLYAAPGSYSVTLTVTTSNGCNGTATYNNAIVVDPKPVANFTVAQVNPCDKFTFQFTNTSSNASSYLWSFGDTSTSTSANPLHTYPNKGNYTVTLIAFSPNGCSDTIVKANAVTVTINNVNFSGTPRSGCPPLPVKFTASNYPNAASWLWNFGDGNTSSIQHPNHIYNTIGNYNVKLKITTSQGCQDSVQKNVYIKVVAGNVNYTVPDTIVGCTPFAVSFANPLPGCDTVKWHFGNGDSSSAISTSYTYLVAGTYVVTFYGSMPGGCKQSINPFAIIKVYDFLPDPITILSSSNCKPYNFSFTNTTKDIVSYLWNFGDGITDTVMSPTHTYANSGTYNVTLTLTNIYGCVKTVSTTVTVGHTNPIQISGLTNCTNDPVQFSILNPSVFSAWLWNFGDGTPTSNSQNPSHIYVNAGSYTVSLITTDVNGCIDTFYSAPIQIANISAGFITNDTTIGCNSLLIQFINTSSGATSYFWDFGDGTTATNTNPNHYFGNPGSYTVSLTASNGGCSKTITKNNFVTIYQATANFSFTSNGNCFPITITCTDLSLNPVSWLWDFGDGTTSTIQNPVHVFNFQPAGPIKLTITDANGCTVSKTKSNITGIPVLAFISDTLGCNPFTVQFSDSTQNAVSWLWNFGDGNSSNQQNPSHTYLNAGIYSVQLTVTSSAGCTSTINLPDSIHVIKPTADFTAPVSAGCAPSLIQFNDLSANAVSWLWNFGDGTSSTTQNPSHIYNIPGDYTISLTIWDSLGCQDTKSITDYIHIPGTYAYFTLTTQLNCLNTFVQFADSSINATTWLWNFGDGYTSTAQNPSHNYQDTGSYIVSLITTDSLGCTSYYVFPDSIVVHPAPTANGAYLSGTTGCAPWTVSFADSSSGATSLMWHFGNGDSSNSSAPVYTYLNSGVFNASIVAINQYGCKDTFNLPVPVNVLMTPNTQFTASPNSGCTDLFVQLTDNSTLLQNPDYFWDFGYGTTSVQQNPAVNYTAAGTYFVQLLVINDNGCADSIIHQVLVKQSPAASGTVSDSSGCAPLTLNFTNSSLNATGYLWVFGDGSTSTLPAPSYSFSTSGIYTPYLIAYSSNGCTDTFFIPVPVNVKLTPDADFLTSNSAGCSGNSFSINNASTQLSNPNYSWTIGNLNSTQQDPTVVLTQPGLYNVSLTVMNDNGCVDSTIKSNFLEVYDTIPPAVTPILSVSVKNNTSVDITWQASAELDLKEYRLYRLNKTTLQYDLILVLPDTNNSNPNVNLVHTDAGLNTLLNTYTYKVQTVDRCDYALPISQSQPHTTINVSAQKSGNNIAVSWTPYGGCAVQSYEINRVEVKTGLSQFLGSVSGSTLNYLDTTLECPFDYSYRITARQLCGNNYISLSDTAIAQPDYALANQKVDVIRSTVVFNKSVLTEWSLPNISPQRVIAYKIMRSANQQNFYHIATVPANVYSYVDDLVEVDDQNYYYHIEVVNNCNLTGALGYEGSSVLLNSDWKNQRTILWWTEYDDWDSGVDYYMIEKKDASGQWVQIKIVDGNLTETELDE